MPCADDRAKCELPLESKRCPQKMLNGGRRIAEQTTHGRECRQRH